MRAILMLLLLAAGAPIAMAQERPLPLHHDAQVQPKLPSVHDVWQGEPSGERMTPSAEAAAAHAAEPSVRSDPLLDEGFWRHVMAGVLITVISTLILRAIL